MDGVSPSDIQNFVASQLYGRRRLNEGRALSGTTNSNISIAYTVNAHVTGQTYTSLSTQLNSAISSGAFDEFLGGYAQQYQVTGLTEVTSTQAVTYETTDTSSAGSGSSTISGGAIGGIVIGVVGGLAIFAFMVYYSVKHKDSINNTGRRSEKKAPVTAEPVEAITVENPLSTKKAFAHSDVEMSTTSYKKQSEESQQQASRRQPDVSSAVNDDNM
eukprot:gene35217-43419_t